VNVDSADSVRAIRFASVIALAAGAGEEYERLHAAVWPEVLSQIWRSNIRNYSIYRMDQLLFSYFEYIGTNYEADMADLARDPATKEWWALCRPLQQQIPGTAADEWWMAIPEVFHAD
jgi:L-rhamnose mutarotase